MKKSNSKNIVNKIIPVFICFAINLFASAPVASDSTYYERNPVFRFETSMYKLNKLRNPYIVMFGDSHIQSARWNELLGNYKVINRGIAGDDTEGMKNRLTEIIKLHPKIVVFEGGINDIYNWVETKTILMNIDYIVRTLLENKIKVVVTSVINSGKKWGEAWIKKNSPQTNVIEYNKGRNKVVKKINLSLKKMCKELGIEFVDLTGKLTENGFLNEEYTRDQLHLNAKGYKIWVKELNKKLKRTKG